MSSYFRRMLALAPATAQHPLDSDTMLKYFLSQLDVRTQLLEPLIAGDTHKEDLLSKVRTDLTSFFGRLNGGNDNLADEAWNEAYRLERLLALVEPADTLVSEVQRRIEEAAEENVPATARLRITFESAISHFVDTAQSPPTLKPGGERRFRAMLLDTLEDTHWTFQRKFHSRPIQKSATRRLVGAGLIACALFVLPYAYIYIKSWLSNGWVLPLQHWAWLPLWTALTAGFFGAMFSRLLWLQANWNALSLGALKDARDFTSVFLRGAVGMTGAVVVYYFLLSGVIGGGLFPKFQEIGLHQLSFRETANVQDAVALRLILPNVQLALLVVWSFLAGFSERLVPSILQSTEASVRNNPTDRK